MIMTMSLEGKLKNISTIASFDKGVDKMKTVELNQCLIAKLMLEDQTKAHHNGYSKN
jgi:hypothetical protein